MKSIVPILALSMCLAATGSATTLTLSGVSLPDTAHVNVSGPSILTSEVLAGPENASLDGGPTFRVFCADLAHFSNGSPTSVTLTDTSSMSTSFQTAAKLYNKFSPTVGNDATLNGGLQVAIWTTLFPAATIVDVTPGIVAQAGVFLSSDLTGASNKATYYDMGGVNQSMIGGYVPQAVPEPTSMAALGLGAVALLKRRKK